MDINNTEDKPDTSKNTQEETELRSKQISAVEYDLALALSSSSETFIGHLVVKFETLQENVSTYLNFRGKEMTKCILNGTSLTENYDGNRVYVNDLKD